MLDFEQHVRKATDGTIIRFFETSQKRYTVQIIFNYGVRDKRLKEYKREKRIIIVKGVSREEAVSAFNAELRKRMI